MLEALLTIFYTLLLLGVINKWQFFSGNGLNPKLISVVFLVKIGFGFLLFAVYYFYYGNNRFSSDAFRFYDDSLVIYEALETNPSHYFRFMFGIRINDPDLAIPLNKMNFWTKEFTHGLFNDNQTIIRFNAFFDIFSFGHYHVHTVFMCFLSLIGLTAMYRAFQPFLVSAKWWLFVCIFLIPSTLFWGSGVLKGGIVLFALGILVWSFFELSQTFSIKKLLVFLGAISLLLFIKIYVIIALFPCLIGYFIVCKTKNYSPKVVYPLVVLVGCILALAIHNNIPSLDIITKLHLKQHDFINMTNHTTSGSGFYLARLNNNPVNFITSIPTAIINTTFRPFIWESNSPFMLYNSLENLGLFLIGFFCIYFRKQKSSINWNVVWFCFIFTFLLYLFIGWTTPISGAIVRYKIPAWSFFCVLFLLLLDEKKLPKRSKTLY